MDSKVIVLQNFSTIGGKLIWESVQKTKFFEFETFSFLFLFYRKVTDFLEFRVLAELSIEYSW